jgi:L-ascorbate metabolism protein UlaG (beta-lactamase superfamily)
MLKKIIRVAVVLCLAVVLIVFLVLQLPAFGGDFAGARLKRMEESAQYKEGRFENTPPQEPGLHLVENLKLYSQDQKREPGFEVPVEPIDPRSLTKAPGLRAYWIGHASTLIEIDGLRVMTDPVFSEYAGPFRAPLVPKRLHRLPIPLEQMPQVDAVVISHDHYDHLDMKAFAARGTHFYVGLGVGAHLERWGVPLGQIHEMDWWDTLELNGVRIHCTPARHYSGRKSMNNSTLWASWYVRGPEHSFYYSGDTGYAPHFAETRRRLGAPDLSIIKVGAYGETWLDIHMDPESAVQAHVDLGAKTLLPVHWATFNLSYHAWEEPILRTLTAAREKKAQVVTPRPGEKLELGKPFESQAWYQAPASSKR